MSFRTMTAAIHTAALLWAGSAFAQTAYLEGHVFNRQTGIPIQGAVVVIYENVSLGPVPILLADGITDANGFYQAGVTTAFPVGVIEVICRTRTGAADGGGGEVGEVRGPAVARGQSSAPLQDDVIRRRDVYLETPRRLRRCLDSEPGDIPPFQK